jgi:formate dehydrogenase major subunit
MPRTLKIEGAKEVINICPFCSVSCHVIASVRDGKLVSTEGDPDYPINQGALCAKGASMLTMTRNEHRLKKPSIAPRTAPSGKKRAGIGFERIASRVKETRDRDLIEANAKGQRSTGSNPCSFSAPPTPTTRNARSPSIHARPGVVHLDHQARSLTQPHCSGSGRVVRTRCDDESLDRHQERRCHSHHGQQCRRAPPHLLQVGPDAKDKGAVVMHVDPKFSRTSARSDFTSPCARARTSPSWAG